jgi:hypothetical protein
MKRSRGPKNTAKQSVKSTPPGPDVLPDGYFLKQSRERFREQAIKIFGDPPGRDKCVVPEGFASARADDSVMIGNKIVHDRRKPGRPAAPETSAVIEAEAQRLFSASTGKPYETQRKISKRFWPDLDPEKRYANYRIRIHDHEDAIEVRLNELKSQ